jgi:hypothetical protein
MTSTPTRYGLSLVIFASALLLLFATAHARSPASAPAKDSSRAESSRTHAPSKPSRVDSRRVPNPVVVPPYRAEIRAAHRVHAEQAKMLCTDCHERATSSREAKDFLGPTAATCERCHAASHSTSSTSDDVHREACAFCHIETSAPSAAASSAMKLERRPTAHLHFSHAAHALHAIGCGQCHGKVAKWADAEGSERIPRKPTCVRCHRGDSARNGGARSACITCHEAEAGRMRTRFGRERLLPSSSLALEHGPQFRFTHGAVAGNEPKACESCHHPRECQACHDGRLRPRSIHPSDWMAMHAIASKQGNDCGSCHRLQSFCLSCHQRVGVVASGAPRALAHRGSVHPPASVWLTGPRGERHHGVMARRNLAECVSCHQERDCIRCHAAGAIGIPGAPSSGSTSSPHPAGFVANCRDLWQRNPRPCLACHRPEGSEVRACQ